jgi:hypothetical protein
MVGSSLLFFLRETRIEPDEEPELDVAISARGATVILKGSL